MTSLGVEESRNRRTEIAVTATIHFVIVRSTSQIGYRSHMNGRIITAGQVVQQHLNHEKSLFLLVRTADGKLRKLVGFRRNYSRPQARLGIP